MKTIKFLGFLSLILLITNTAGAVNGQMTTLSIAAGDDNALALRSDGTVWCWGTNQYVAGFSASTFPVRVSSLSNVTAISSGEAHFLAVTNGAAWGWGANESGELGNGTLNDGIVPVRMGTITNAIAVAGGSWHSMILLSNGQVMACGANRNGPLGNGTTNSSLVPVYVSTLTNVIRIVAGNDHAAALTASGDVWCWGRGKSGEIGNGALTNVLSPVKALNLSNIVDLASGTFYNLALKADGTVWAWGGNDEGQLGLGHTNNVSIPTRIFSLNNVQTIGAGYTASFATLTNGQTMAWGFQNGTKTTPIALAEAPPFKEMVSGYGVRLGLAYNGSVWAWGADDLGNFGNGITATPALGNFALIPMVSFTPTPVARWGKFTRGNICNLSYCPVVVPLDMQEGVGMIATGNDAYWHSNTIPWFYKVQKQTLYTPTALVTGSTNLARVAVENPLVAFGSQGCGSPFYVNQPYSFAVYAGGFDESMASATNAIKISVYDRTAFNSGGTNIAPINTFNISLPRRTVTAESNLWSAFMLTNYAAQTFETNGLRTTVEFLDYDAGTMGKPFMLKWMTNSSGNPVVMTNFFLCGYKLTHTATSTNYFYKVEVLGKVQVSTSQVAPMATDASGTWSPTPLYTMDFEQRPFLRSIFVDRLFFNGTPLPPTYAGASLKELNGLSMLVTNVVNLTNSPAYTNIDASPELRRHPLLDQLVLDLNKDPLALASYVINEIGLTDPYAVVESNQVVKAAINCGGVDRSALGTFLEGQGSPVEQCSLLVYLLRQAGYPAAYVFPTNGNLMMLDTRISQLWRMQVKGVVSWNYGDPFLTNSLITVNYPWVVANIGTNTVHIFPWLKDTEIVEGVDLYDYMPTNYNTALKWVEDYVRGNTNLLSLDSENVPFKLFPKFVQQCVLTNAQGVSLSLDDLGVRAFNRRHQFPSWVALPKPNFVTNTSKVAVVGSLSDSTNTFPFLANAFNTVAVNVYKNTLATTNLLLTTSTGGNNWYSCDLHNRKFLLFTNNSRLCLWLAPYRPGITNIESFLGPSSTALQSNSVAIPSASSLEVDIAHMRKAIKLPSSQLAYTFPITDSGGDVISVTCRNGDTAGICLDFGGVTEAMLRPFAETYWGLQRQRATNINFMPPVQDYQGTAAYLLGMSYFEKIARFEALNRQYHKISGLVNFSSGLGKISTGSSGTNMQASVDMRVDSEVWVADGTLRPDAGAPLDRIGNYATLQIANGSAEEHHILQSIFPDQDAISTIRLLQMAQQRATNGNSPILELINNNYVAKGDATCAGYPGPLKSQDPSIWSSITNTLAQSSDGFTRVLITPGLITNSTKSYVGMGALTLGFGNQKAAISGNTAPLNGGVGNLISGMTPQGSNLEFPYNLYANNGGGYAFSPNTPGSPAFDPVRSLLDSMYLNNGSVPTVFSPVQDQTAGDVLKAFFGSGLNTATALQLSDNAGYFEGPTCWIRDSGEVVFDPVSVINGGFYVDATDLTLPGPMPLQLRRNYISQNLTDNQLGFGWKQNFMPYLVLATNTSNQSIIYAAEMDGAVIAYHQTNGTWLVLPQDNPTLNNNSTGGVGASANVFNARIDCTNSTNYVLTAPDGSKRYYQVMSGFGLSSGTNSLNRIRPYLTRWEDHAGNYHLFSYGTNSTENDYGQLTRIDSANGNCLVFKYDFFGRIYQASTGDGRIVKYEYDNFGDLVTVTLPDDSKCQYEYEHYSFTTNGISIIDSDHLMTKEIKPNGRIVANVYDTLRRVTSQSATVGTNLVLVTNAWFYYTNNAATQTNGLLSGYTRVEDVFHNPAVYYYTNNLITNTVDALGLSATQIWFQDGATNLPGYYPRSVSETVDKRGLTNDFYYDFSGNVTQAVVRGDLTGENNPNQSATNTFTYTTNNLPSTSVDSSGNGMQLVYGDSADSFRPTSVFHLGGGTAIATNQFSYTNVSQVVLNGTRTNLAFGLRWQEVRQGGATNQTFFDGRGYPIEQIRYPATAEFSTITDPPVTTFFIYTARGELYQQQIAGGATTQMDYDAMSRPLSKQVFDQSGQLVSSEYYYYNRNGELEWYDGPRYDPEDYVWNHYDGAGRVIQQTRWRSQAKQDGTGVEAPDGYDLYATTFNEYDSFGNLKRTINPRGVVTTNSWDKLGRLVMQTVLETNGMLLKSEGFAYEAGGEIAFATNALVGVTETRYTSTGKPRYKHTPDGATSTWVYKSDGRLSLEYLPNNAYWETTYQDANRRTTRIFHAASGASLATNVIDLDGRGNVARRVDPANSAFTNYFDGLDRLKVAAGPMITFEFPTNAPTIGTPPAPIQQTITNFFDASGLVVTNVNALREKTITYSDVLGRVTKTEVRDATNTLIRQTTSSYAANHQSTTTTVGTGATAITSTVYTDVQGNPVLTIGYPSSAVQEFTLRRYDPVENLVSESRNSTANGSITPWTSASYSYDGLNRPGVQIDRDNAATYFGYDSAGNLTNRVVPGGSVAHRAVFNSAMQMLADYDISSGSAISRSNSYTYNPSTGRLQTRTDGRGVTSTLTYDDWLRPATSTYTGSLPEHGLTTVWNYDPRGLLTNVVEGFASTNTGPTTSIKRSYDAYGQLLGESVSGGDTSYNATQSRDAAGRRSALGLATFGFAYNWRADGLLASVQGQGASASYAYDLAGQLQSRTVGARITSITQRDGDGRALAISTTVNSSSVLGETLAWTGDGLLSAHTMNRSDFTDSRSFAYANQSRRLMQEQLGLNSSTNWTNSFIYDSGLASGPGVLTRAGQSGTSGLAWKGGVDGFSRIGAETNSLSIRAASGRVNGQATVSAFLDGSPMPVTTVGTNALQWRALLEMTPGRHELKVSADHPLGQFTAWATNSFTNAASDHITVGYNASGELTNRVWLTSSGQTNRIQTYSWDAKGRLHGLTERDATNTGFNWSAVYDGLGRRLETVTVPITNGVVVSTNSAAISQFFDPEVEFLEIGEAHAGVTTWKLYGPDLNGVYGGMNGIGGLEGVGPAPGQFVPVIADARGNIHGEISLTNGLVWFPSRVTGYGAVPGYRPLTIGGNTTVERSSAWRGKWPDITGYVWMGDRYYVPETGSWMSYDSFWNGGDSTGFSYCGGDPVNRTDSDGRIGKGTSLALTGSGNAYQFNQYDTYYLGWNRTLQGESLRSDPLAKYSMPITDWSSEAFNGNSFRMTFGNEATAFADAAINLNPGTSFIGSLAEVADSSKAAGVASVEGSGTDQALAYTRAGLAVGTAFLALEEPINGAADGTSHVFWSGGQAAEDAARTFASANNGVIIGDTAAGQALAQSTAGVSWSQAMPQWLSMSENFAKTASGEVNVFQNARGLSVDSIWRNEYQILKQNPNVTKIIFNVVMPNGSVIRLP